MIFINVFSKRPLFSSCIIFLLFSVIAYFAEPKYKFVIAGVMLTLLVLFLILRICKRVKPYTFLCILLSCIMITLSVISSYFFFNVKEDNVDEYYGKEIRIEALVVGERYRSGGFSGFDIVVTSVDGVKNKHNAILACTYDASLEPGFSFSATVEGSDFSSFLGSYDQKPAMHSDGIFIQYTSLDESKSTIIEEGVFHPRVFFSSINKTFSNIFYRYLDKDTANMCSAILLGNKNALSNTVIRDFTRSGASHILALSGMHMTIIMGIFLFILKRLRINPKIIAVVLSFLALAYLFITGLQISAARSVIMLLIVYLSVLSEKTPDSLTSLGFAGMLLMLFFPGSVVDAGYWMSFAATLGILVYTTPFVKYIRLVIEPFNLSAPLKKAIVSLLSAFAVSLFATVPLITVLCIFIKQFSLFSIITSIVLSIPSAGIILFSLIFIALAPTPGITAAVGAILSALTELMTAFCERVSDIEGVVVSLVYPFATLAAIIIIATILYSFASKVRNLFISLIPYAVALALFVSAIVAYNAMESNRIRIEFVNSSSQTDMLVISKGGEAVICDVGNGSKSSYNEATGYAALSRVTELRAIMLTKYSRAHSAALYETFTTERVRELWVPYPENEKEYYLMTPLVSLAEEYGVDTYVYRRGDDLKAFDFALLRADACYISRSAVPSVTVNLKTRNGSLTYCGSAFNECDNVDSTNKYLKGSDYVIFGTVGPKTKTEFALPEGSRAHTVVFGNETLAAYFSDDFSNDFSSFLVEESCKFYLKE